MSRPTGVMKITNDYAQAAMDEMDASKTVWAALAYSLAMRLSEDNESDALALLRDEWGTLHRAGIIPQRPKAARAEGGAR